MIIHGKIAKWKKKERRVNESEDIVGTYYHRNEKSI